MYPEINVTNNVLLCRAVISKSTKNSDQDTDLVICNLHALRNWFLSSINYSAAANIFLGSSLYLLDSNK